MILLGHECNTALLEILSEIGKSGHQTPESHRVKKDPADTFKPEWVWKNIFLFMILHYCGFWGLWRLLSFQIKWQTHLWTWLVGFVTVQAITVGNHRFFTHKSFKGNYWFKLLAMLTQTAAGQNCIYTWARDHRLHHKFSDTDADPHNASRGFFFCHMGWLLQRKHPMVKIKGKSIDMSDLEADPIVMFQKKYYYPLYAVLAFGIPVSFPVYFWGEALSNSILVCYFFRYMIVLHGTWTVNSIAHFYGYRPYSKDIRPVESEFVAFISTGEGWHNYHHTFPWDYRASEFGKRWNLSTKLVDWLASIGWAYDLKCATPEMVAYRINKRGDGTHPTVQKNKDQASPEEAKVDGLTNTTIKKTEDMSDEEATKKFGGEDFDDLYGERITSEGFTILQKGC